MARVERVSEITFDVHRNSIRKAQLTIVIRMSDYLFDYLQNGAIIKRFDTAHRFIEKATARES